MNFKDLTEKEAISFHLSLLDNIDEKTVVFSSLIGVLRDAREITGRDLQTGQRLSNPNHGRSDSWLGASGYLTVLDQLGKCYRPKSKQRLNKINSITKALKYFTHLSDHEIASIYALRCAFSHDYSLFNIGNNGADDKLTQHFTVTGLGFNNLISLPNIQWNGNHSEKTIENRTIINLPLLGDLVEEIYKAVIEYFNHDELDVDLERGFIELKDRYLIFMHSTKNGS